MEIYPQSESILVRLAPSLASTIASELRLMTTELYLDLAGDRDLLTESIMVDSAKERSLRTQLRRVPTSQYQYLSTIAQQLAAKFRLTPLEICENLQSRWHSRQIKNKNTNFEVRCWYNTAGYLYFHVNSQSIAAWLGYLHDLPLATLSLTERRSATSTVATPSMSLAIYAHARCCSVLRLAHTQKLVAICGYQIATPNWLEIDPSVVKPIADPDDLDRSPNGLRTQLDRIFEEPTEIALIHTLMDVLDGICSGLIGTPERLKPDLATALAQSWLEFHRHCRIFGSLPIQNPRLAIARCGLTAIARRYLAAMLEDYLGVLALEEL